MNQEDANNLSQTLSRSHGLEMSASLLKIDEGSLITLVPVGVSIAESFTLKIFIGWKRLSLEFVPGNFSQPFIRECGSLSADSKSVFLQLVDDILDRGADVFLEINGKKCSIDSYENWPVNWSNFSLKMRTPFIESEGDLSKDSNGVDEVFRWSHLFLNLIICFLPIDEEVDIIPDAQVGEAEGRVSRVEVNKYERSRINRLACITLSGTICSVCGFDFSEKYGKYGDGFIIVHHIVPVSQIGNDYIINPLTDLVPVCANCHAMIHRKNPPYTIKEIREMLIC